MGVLVSTLEMTVSSSASLGCYSLKSGGGADSCWLITVTRVECWSGPGQQLKRGASECVLVGSRVEVFTL